MGSSQRKALSFSAGLKSFLGHLEGTQKSLQTLKNYKTDLLSFEGYLKKQTRQRIALNQLTPRDLEQFAEYLKAKGLKTNTRRRRLLTLRKYLRYLGNRSKVSQGLSQRFEPPARIERIPQVMNHSEVLGHILQLPVNTVLRERNRLILWILAETGCLVSEVGRLRVDCAGTKESIEFLGDRGRKVPISPALKTAIERYADHSKLASRKQSTLLLESFNRHGSMGTPLSSRGIELLVRAHAERLGSKELVPRMIRHSVALAWHQDHVPQEEIQRRLGLRSDYAFRVYKQLWKSSENSANKPA